VRSLTDCSPDTITGRVEAIDTGYQVTRADGTAAHFGAYVDPGGRLHLGFGTVGRELPDGTGTVTIAPGVQLTVQRDGCVLAPDGTGTVTIAPGVQLTVQRDGCVDVEGGQAHSVPCRFVRDRGRTVLEYSATDIAAPGGTRQAGLVLVSKYRLLVSPELVDRVYAR